MSPQRRRCRGSRAASPATRIVLGGGFVNTELRELTEPRVFDYFDYVTLDAGERPLLALLELQLRKSKALGIASVACDGTLELNTEGSAQRAFKFLDAARQEVVRRQRETTWDALPTPP